jgi:hypothetical protein
MSGEARCSCSHSSLGKRVHGWRQKKGYPKGSALPSWPPTGLVAMWLLEW